VKINLALIFGGLSNEREISIKTASSVRDVLFGISSVELFEFDFQGDYDILLDFINSNNIDLVFIALHGGEGENGSLQFFLEENSIQYTGSDSSASKIAINKNLTKRICSDNYLPTPKWNSLDLSKDSLNLPKLLQKYDNSCVVKPTSDGSSIGMSIIFDHLNEQVLERAINKCKEVSDNIIIEEYIGGRELTVSLIDGIALPVVEIFPKGKFYDYNSKYTTGQSKYEVPAKLSFELESEIIEYAENLYELVGCDHYARVDFILDKNDEAYILELNTLPGLTETSLFPKAYHEEFKDYNNSTSKTYDLLVLEIIKLALK
tara:strand:- start:229 stop:1185 length:957 start_codon:yes stop_codon:yes gene_type:complete